MTKKKFGMLLLKAVSIAFKLHRGGAVVIKELDNKKVQVSIHVAEQVAHRDLDGDGVVGRPSAGIPGSNYIPLDPPVWQPPPRVLSDEALIAQATAAAIILPPPAGETRPVRVVPPAPRRAIPILTVSPRRRV